MVIDGGELLKGLSKETKWSGLCVRDILLVDVWEMDYSEGKTEHKENV